MCRDMSFFPISSFSQWEDSQMGGMWNTSKFGAGHLHQLNTQTVWGKVRMLEVCRIYFAAKKQLFRPVDFRSKAEKLRSEPLVFCIACVPILLHGLS